MISYVLMFYVNVSTAIAQKASGKNPAVSKPASVCLSIYLSISLSLSLSRGYHFESSLEIDLSLSCPNTTEIDLP